MPIKNDREYRKAAPFKAQAEGFIVEGYASTFEPYEMYEFEGVKYFERVERKAFKGTDMSDVIMQYDHAGRVFARQSNGSLELSVDDHGLKIRADLSRTAGAKELYDDIAQGMIKDMSFAFTVAEDYFDDETNTRVITRFKKIYDVSAVSIPANPTTEIGISARSYFEGVIEARRLEEAKREKHKAKIRILAEV